MTLKQPLWGDTESSPAFKPRVFPPCFQCFQWKAFQSSINSDDLILLHLVHQMFSLHPTGSKTRGEILTKMIRCVNEASQAMWLVSSSVHWWQHLQQVNENLSPLNYQGIYLWIFVRRPLNPCHVYISFQNSAVTTQDRQEHQQCCEIQSPPLGHNDHWDREKPWTILFRIFCFITRGKSLFQWR